MKLKTKDLTFLVLFTILYSILYNYMQGKLKEVITFIPFHAFISLGYYAIMSVSINIMLISNKIYFKMLKDNCDSSYENLLKDIDEAKSFFKKNDIKV